MKTFFSDPPREHCPALNEFSTVPSPKASPGKRKTVICAAVCNTKQADVGVIWLCQTGSAVTIEIRTAEGSAYQKKLLVDGRKLSGSKIHHFPAIISKRVD